MKNINPNNYIEIRAVHTPGFTEDHMSFYMTLSAPNDSRNYMIGGDLVIDPWKAMLWDLSKHIDSLELLKDSYDFEYLCTPYVS